MQSNKDLPAPTGSQTIPQIPVGFSLMASADEVDFAVSDEIQSILDTTMSKSMSKALASAMDVMSTSLSKTFTQAILQAQMSVPPTSQTVAIPTASHPGRKALATTKHAKTIMMDSIPPATDGARVNPPHKRATGWVKAARLWKRAKAQHDSAESELSDEEVYDQESALDPSDDLSDPESDYAIGEGEIPSHVYPSDGALGTIVSHLLSSEAEKILDPQGEPLFDPDDLRHPRSAKWSPFEHVACYIGAWVRKPLERVTCNMLRAECPCPTVPDEVCKTPQVNPKIAQFLGKSGWKLRKGLDVSL
ncbi:Hypothetical predicted protein [Pelobates cultripes]|uniref:Uncharacterized protein n=1 Tax=Pelobates cultripes TaxID=61616 RepID=A0AAD1VZ78_PELCU|nr:Hypothetical predicted protein [Pelobates cultripes]